VRLWQVVAVLMLAAIIDGTLRAALICAVLFIIAI
jgi:hypothetical protein